MILADKIVRLRKKNGWSQEELAQKQSQNGKARRPSRSWKKFCSLERCLELRQITF